MRFHMRLVNTNGIVEVVLCAFKLDLLDINSGEFSLDAIRLPSQFETIHRTGPLARTKAGDDQGSVDVMRMYNTNQPFA